MTESTDDPKKPLTGPDAPSAHPPHTTADSGPLSEAEPIVPEPPVHTASDTPEPSVTPPDPEPIGPPPARPARMPDPSPPPAAAAAAAAAAAVAADAHNAEPVAPVPARTPMTGEVMPREGATAHGAGHAHHPYAPVLKHLSVPNVLSAGRCLSVIVIVVLLLWPWGPLLTAALVVFGLASLTDWLDGRIARAFNLTSDLGRMLDSIADKLLVGVTLLTLCAIGIIDDANVVAAGLILFREIAISGLREHLAPRGVVVPATQLAKWKTTFQMFAIAALMASPLAPFETVARVAALLILWAAMGMTVVSGIQYAWATRHVWNEE